MLQVLVERCPRRRISGDHSDLDLHGSSTNMDKDISLATALEGLEL